MLNTGQVARLVSGTTYVFTAISAGTADTGTTYTVTAADTSGATATSTVTVPQPQIILKAGATISKPCSGAATVTLVPITTLTPLPGFTYTFNGVTQSSPVFTNVAPGTYQSTIAVTSAGTPCAVSTVVVPGALVSLQVTNPTSATATGSITAAVQGVAPVTATLQPGSVVQVVPPSGVVQFTNLPAGTYTVTVADSAGCTDSEGATLTPCSRPVTSNELTNFFSKVYCPSC